MKIKSSSLMKCLTNKLKIKDIDSILNEIFMYYGDRNEIIDELKGLLCDLTDVDKEKLWSLMIYAIDWNGER